MKTHLLSLVALLGLFAGACQSTSVPTITAVSGTSPVVFKANGSAIIDDFEANQTQWLAGVWPRFTDSSATGAQNVPQHATRGRQALQLSFDWRNLPKAVFYQNQEFDLSNVQTMGFDLYNEDGAAAHVAVAFRSGNRQYWQESRPVAVKPGSNAVMFDLHAPIYQSEPAQGQYTATLDAVDHVHQLAIVIFPARSGTVYIDKLLAIGAAEPATPPASESGRFAPHVAIHPARTSLKQFDLLELEIDTDIKANNPFDPEQIAIDIVFDSPAGGQITVPAFFSQDYNSGTHEPIWPQRWIARFTPTLEGSWIARARIKSGQINQLSEPVTFGVTPGINRGFVRVDSQNPQYLAFDNSEAFLPVGRNLA